METMEHKVWAYFERLLATVKNNAEQYDSEEDCDLTECVYTALIDTQPDLITLVNEGLGWK